MVKVNSKRQLDFRDQSTQIEASHRYLQKLLHEDDRENT